MSDHGLVRVLANPKYGSAVSTVPSVIDRLKRFRASGHHVFWPDEVSLCDGARFKPASARGHRQLTDVYLLGLAQRNGARLVTFDHSIPIAAVAGATRETLVVVAPDDEG